MTVCARQINMPTGKTKSCIIVREAGNRLPLFCGMARSTLRSELSVMDVVVTCRARRTEPEVCAVTQQRLICTDIRCLNKLSLMARCAGQAPVFSVKGKPRRLLMIIPGLVEPCDAERTAMVLFVTLHTLMTGQLRMVPLVGGDSRFEFLMTVQTFIIGYGLADRMAAGTI